ncbi:penicillin-binding protein 1B [Idiomarina zobellii]|uniref:Penicillin-binding protein 1B n=1 Tax=Idiomarina zobellii TaxID=86103 RepID=A0A837NCB9_9GAMM|nr:penicillin-binding protein 1B [Idiomarina zobellii]KPD23523.1 peptidoglycan synthetase [Idiomarina zobellii]SDF95789.1 penicillin-binding protein 1B [Idiomarina zobellii]
MIKRQWLSYLFWTSFKIGLAVAAVIAVYAIYLDATLSKHFKTERYQAPALVYAGELRVYPGYPLQQSTLIKTLERIGYNRSNNTEQSGYYSVGNDSVMVHRRPFDFSDGPQMSKRVQVHFVNDRVASITSWPSGRELDSFRLEPELIGRISTLSKEDRLLVGLEVVPNLLIETLLQVEDRNFYHHKGVSPWAILRALVANLRAGRTVQGGSTLTQQLVKNLYLTREQTLWRKFHEAMMSLVIDYRFDKNTILETYLNEVYFGQDGRNAIHGIGLASQFYFGKQVQELSVDEVALLIGMIKGPSYYDPRRFPERAQERRDTVLKVMFDQDLIAKSTYVAAVQRQLDVRESRRLVEHPYPHYMDIIKREMKTLALPEDWQDTGLKIYTHMDVNAQEAVQKSLARKLTDDDSTLEGAMVVANYRQGTITALAGGRLSQTVGYNRALMALRPIGSLIKPVIYATAMQESGIGLHTPVVDEAITLEDKRGKTWQPQNYDTEFKGSLLLYDALVQSRNIPAVRVGVEVGVDTVVDYMKRLGVVTPLEEYPSLTLGSASLTPFAVTRMYSALMNDGRFQSLSAISSITTHQGDVLYRTPEKSTSQVFDSKVAYLTKFGLHGVVAEGTASALQRVLAGQQVGGKTGTTNDYRDSWFVAVDGEQVVTAWLGRDDNQPTGLTGSSGALRVVADYYERKPPLSVALEVPEPLKMQRFHERTGQRIPNDCGNGELLPAEEIRLPDNITCAGNIEEKSWWDRLFGG